MGGMARDHVVSETPDISLGTAIAGLDGPVGAEKIKMIALMIGASESPPSHGLVLVNNLSTY